MFPIFSAIELPFKAYSIQHFGPIGIAVIFTISIIQYANKYLNEKQKTILGTCLAFFPFVCVIGRMSYLISIGTFDSKLDLPFFLCRFMSLILPLVFYTRNRLMLGILYFWVLAGTVNAILTPDLKQGPFHWEYNLYWVYHLMLIVTILYGVFVYKFKITWKDYRNAVLATIAFTVFSGLINFLLKANYNYLSAKPDVASILDHMGPWPWYIVSVYGLMFFLFFLALLPYLRKGRA